MTDKEIDEEKLYGVGETAELANLSSRQIVRLVDKGMFPGSRRKSPVPGSPRVIPGSAIISFLEARKSNQ